MSTNMHMYKWYSDFYLATATSKAYSSYCSKVFGKDFSQHGFSDIYEINKILNLSGIKESHAVLDLGCGNGKMIEYVHDQYNVNAYGLDYSDTAINQANARTVSKHSKLKFIVGCIGEKIFPDNTFDIIFSIETIFFGESMTKTIKVLHEMLKPTGSIITTYMLRKAETDCTHEAFNSHSNHLASTIKELGLAYTVTDFTDHFYTHMKTKRITAEKLADRFKVEDNMFLYENIMMESIDKDMTLKEFRVQYARYCYCIRGKS